METSKGVTVAQADLLYLVKVADWAAGQGFCDITGIDDPEEWCLRKWGEAGPPDGAWYSAEALAAALAHTVDATDGEREAHLEHIIDRDRYIVAAVVGAIKRAINGRAWLLGGGRGPYEWDDERYKDEFRGAVEEIEAAAEPLAHVGWDKSDCTRIEGRVEAARLAAREFLNRPAPKREMIAADIGLPCHACSTLSRQPAAEADEVGRQVERIARVIAVEARGYDAPIRHQLKVSDAHRQMALAVLTALNRADNAEG